MTNRRRLAVIIVSANSGRWLRKCLSSVLRHLGDIELDLVVVASGCTDDTLALVEREFPQARSIETVNYGFAHANNRALATTSADFVLFLNPDTEILEGSLDELVSIFEKRPELGVVGVRQVGSTGRLEPSLRRFPSVTRWLCESLGSERWPVHRSWTGERMLDPLAYVQETSVDWVSGSFLLTRRDVLDRVVSMDERFFLYCEEPDLCLRVKGAGWGVSHLPVMTIVHHGGNDSRDPRLAAQLAHSRRLYMEKHFIATRRLAGTFALTLGYLLRARRATARAALFTLLRLKPPPFSTAAASRKPS
jgi:GT2 family glycosyltransferase